MLRPGARSLLQSRSGRLCIFCKRHSMAKRKQDAGDSDSGSDSEVNLIDVDFDFFSPNPNVDYHAIKRLLRQLFNADAELFHLHELTELVLSQPAVGTTIKTDGEETDPYALLTVLNMHVHRAHPAVQAIGQYLLQKTQTAGPSGKSFHDALVSLFAPEQTQNHVGFVICERLINMPVQVMPPMYRMLGEEITEAIAENEPYRFSHLLFISRTYHLSQEDETLLTATANARVPSAKKVKKAPSQNATTQQRPADGIYSFHPEDELIMQHATHTLNYTFTQSSATPRDAESFGLDTRGRAMLVPAERLPELVARMAETFTT
ncbi:hypothetical protein HGRIS_014753 [Hohenbuehelia grisea]|uniref:Protein BCP1 n=1 Tax=Hohenbuehelia grisea TaxID=104357 RepID=A0ABR3IQM0_9AGAR